MAVSIMAIAGWPGAGELAAQGQVKNTRLGQGYRINRKFAFSSSLRFLY